ncbi:MAG TPA: hypothetical protein VF698_08925 [Thermoanaerobaculia bacterium]
MKLLRVTFVVLLAACATSAPTRKRIEPRSDFLVNLHQRLLGDAAERTPRTFEDLAPDDRAVWLEAVDAYRKGGVDELIDVRIAAADQPDAIDAKWRAIFDRTAPVYRKTWWAADDAKNRAFIAMLQPLVDAHGAAILEEQARVYGMPAPARASVDIAAYAGPFGAQTLIHDSGIPYVTISPLYETYRGNAALEELMHELSHSLAFHNRGVVGGTIEAHAKALGIRHPRDLWHAILFFNTGEVTRRYFAARGVEYEPYAFRTGVYDRMSGDYLPAVRKWWPQVIDGKLSAEEGVRRIVEEIAKR